MLHRAVSLIAGSVVLLSFCQSAIRSSPPIFDESKVKDEIQESAARKPYLVPGNQLELFKNKFRERFQSEPVLVATLKQSSVFLMNTEQTKDTAFGKIQFQDSGRRPPFVYFDPSYAARLEKGYTSIEDLISGYKDAALNEVLLAGVVRAHSDISKLHIIGNTSLGKNILALEVHDFKSQRKKIPVLFTCAMHANELTATEHCYSILYHILKEPARYADILQNISIWLIPIANPDGSHLFWHHSTAMGRKNAHVGPGQNSQSLLRGTDLNRNFPFRWNSGHPKASSEDPNSVYFRGTAPGSENETKAIMNLSERERFVYAISFHAVSGKILIPYTIENVKNPSPDYATALAKELVPITKHHNKRRGFRAIKNIYPVDGTDQDYLYFKHGTIAYIIESSYRNCEFQYVHYYIDGYRPLWEAFLRNYAQNRKFALRITNGKGEPIEAAVRFSDLTWFHSEKHTSNPIDGSFFRPTKGNAPVDVTISARGYRTKKIELNPQGPGNTEPETVMLEADAQP